MTKLSIARRNLCLSMACIALAATLPETPAGARSADPAAQRIETFYAALLDAMKQAKQLGTQGRYDKLLPVVSSTFDVPGMAKVACGAAWAGMQPAQQTAVVDAFKRMMVATYASRFDGYSGERLEVGDVAEQAPDKIVRTSLVQSSGKVVSLNYLMRKAGDGWRIADVYLDGTISELAGRRAEFASLLKSGGAEALTRALHAKGDKMLAAG